MTDGMIACAADCRELLMLLADGLRDHLAELAQLTWTAGRLSAELHGQE